MDEVKSLSIDYDLNLSDIKIESISKDIIFPDELNAYLRKQLNSTERENKSLKEQLQEKETNLKQSQTKIEQLSKKIRDNKTIIHNNISVAQLNNKIQELDKKFNNKTIELEEYKTKYLNLEKEINEKTSNNELKKLQDKLNSTTNKLIEAKNSNTQLKHDLKLANKWLQQEIGDNFETLHNITSLNCNWRGRAQIICDLQIKVRELRDKLTKTYQENESEALQTIKPPAADKKFENLTQENVELKHNFEDLKKKLDVTKARCKFLETESRDLKLKVATLNDNINEYKKIVSQLDTQLLNQTNLNNESNKQKDKFIKNLKQDYESLKIDLAKANCFLENKVREIEEKNNEIESLRKKIRNSRPPSSYGVPQQPSADVVPNKAIGQLEAERVKLLELIEMQNKRLSNERESYEKIQKQLRLERQKGAKLEANVARLDLELNSSRTNSYSNKLLLIKPSQVEESYKDQLELAEENIKALTTRLEIEMYERQVDVKEFGKILKNCNCKF